MQRERTFPIDEFANSACKVLFRLQAWYLWMAVPYCTERNVKFSGLLYWHVYRNARCEIFEDSVNFGFRNTSVQLVHGTLLATCISFACAAALCWVRGGTVGWGTTLQVWRLRVRFPMVSLEFFIDIFLPAALWPRGLTQPLTENRNISWLVKTVGAESWNLYHLHCRLYGNLGASSSWNPLGLSRPIMGLLYLLPIGLVCCGYFK